MSDVNQSRISGLSVIVTAGTRGIGEGISRELARRGMSLTLSYLDRDEQALKVCHELEELTTMQLYKGDLTSAEGAGELVRKAIEKFGKVDALVSNLGPFLYKSIVDTSVEEWDMMIKANLSSHFYLVKALLSHMRERKSGNFVFVGGVGNDLIKGHAKSSAYYAAKIGLGDFVRSLAIEEAGNGIRANMVSPGVIDNGEYSEGFRKRIIDEIPVGYMGEPKDIANMVGYLMSEEARYITGAIIDVSGGYHLK
jgi:3-oxoacyl-[acyl-carrier protein] reductase